MSDVDARPSPGPALTLGPGGPAISPLGVGAWAWGDWLFWQYGQQQSAADVRAAFQATLAAGVNLIDTAEFYGFGRSERLLRSLLRDRGAAAPRPVVATKFFPYAWRLRRADLLRALRGSLARLGLPAVDLYLVHWPWPPRPVETWAAGLAEAHQAGLARSVGVSNYSLAQMDRAQAVLARHGVPLAANQVQFSLLCRAPERDGLLAACRERGVVLIAHSPLAEGLLTGKYGPDWQPSGWMRWRFGRGLLQRIQPLVALLADIGRAHGGKTPAQVAINWIMAKGAVPIPGARNAHQAAQNAGALGWCLAAEQVAALDEMSDRVRRP